MGQDLWYKILSPQNVAADKNEMVKISIFIYLFIYFIYAFRDYVFTVINTVVYFTSSKKKKKKEKKLKNILLINALSSVQPT